MKAAKPAPTNHDIAPTIANRWSARAINGDQPVEHAKVLTMLEAARWAPSCFGDEPWRFLVCDKYRDANAWEGIAGNLAEGNQTWARNAPVLMVACANTAFSRNDKPNRWGGYDTGAASVSLHMQGVELGLVVHQMGGFDPDGIRSRFEIPDRFDPIAAIAIGYPAPPESLADEGMIKGETGARKRREMSEIAFDGQWGKAIAL